MVVDLNKRTYFLVTGASRGIGQAMAIQMAEKFSRGSLVVLLARNQEGLNNTKESIETKVTTDVRVLTYTMDLSIAKAEDFQHLLRDSLEKTGTQPIDFERAFIIHNAGTVGDVSKKAAEISDVQLWASYYNINVFSAIALNVEFFKIFIKIPKLVVNLSSKCALEPFASMSLYCSGKAARELYFRVLATEEADDAAVVLNYAPGAIDTDMTIYVQNQTVNTDLHKAFKEQRENKTMLTATQTTEKLIKILQNGNFKSGDHIDYWD